MVFFIAIGLAVFWSLIFRFKPKNGKKIYTFVFAHRGFHLFQPENTLASFKAAVDANLAVELDVRHTKDNILVCFHDRYTKRLLDIPGKISMFTYDNIKEHTVLRSKEKVPTLDRALKIIAGRVPILIELKGTFRGNALNELMSKYLKYSGEVYFHTKNIFNYYSLKKLVDKDKTQDKKVYYILNVFRKRFNFVKGKDYSSEVNKYNELASNVDIELPSIHDISSIIVRSIENLEDKREILATIGAAINKYESRIKLNDTSHWVYKSLWLHRGIVSTKYPEHSKESFIECKRYAKKNKISVTVEFDVMLHKGQVTCYHSDRISNIFGQSKSCVEKLKLSNAMTFREVLEVFSDSPNINLAIDIKDYHIRDRALEDLIIKELEESNYTGNFIMMSYNPFVLLHFKKKRPDWLRAQIGHSLNGLRKVPIFRFPSILNGILGMLFDLSCADCTVFDNSKWIFYLIAYHKNIKGKPVLIYAPKTYLEQKAFIGHDSIANFIVENVKDSTAWPKEYINKFKI